MNKTLQLKIGNTIVDVYFMDNDSYDKIFSLSYEVTTYYTSDEER